MFNNIKSINGTSSSNDTSVIRIIDHIVFGREAIVQLGKLLQIDSRLESNDPGLVTDDLQGNVNDSSNTGVTGGLPIAGGVSDSISYHKRYVNPDFEPIAASQVNAVLGGDILPETNLELIVAKRVPFRIAVRMDERKINEFVAICANSEFVFEINQLRINRHTAGEQMNSTEAQHLLLLLEETAEEEEELAVVVAVQPPIWHRAAVEAVAGVQTWQLRVNWNLHPLKAELTSWCLLNSME